MFQLKIVCELKLAGEDDNANLNLIWCYISSSITLSIEKLHNVLEESKKLNVPAGINAIINF